MSSPHAEADVIVVGAGLAGLVATAELVDAGKRVLLVEQEPAASLGGQALWSFGGLFLIDSPEQRRMGIKDSPRPGPAGLVRQRRVRPRGGPLAAALGRGLPRLRRRREAGLAAREGRALLPRRRLGRARRLHRAGPRQLGAPVPHRLGHRARHPRALHRHGPRRRAGRTRHARCTGTGSTRSSSRAAPWSACAAASCAPSRRRAERPAPATSSATSSCAPRP